jgi:hypothetical protein
MRLADERKAIFARLPGTVKGRLEDGANSSDGLVPWALVVSNHRPPPCKGGALPLS